MVKLHVNGDRVNIPLAWKETTAGLAQRIIADWDPDLAIDERSKVKLFAIMIDKPYKAVLESEDYELEGMIYACTRFVYEEDFNYKTAPIPKELIIGGTKVQIPDGVGRLTIGQNMHVRKALRPGVDHRTLMSLIVAIYLQPLIDAVNKEGKWIKGEFDIDRALELEPLVKDLPATDVFPLGFFLLSQRESYGSGFLTRFAARILRRHRSVRLQPI